MGDDAGKSSAAKLVKRLGAVTTAAAALLAGSVAHSRENDVMRGILDRAGSTLSLSASLKQEAVVDPPPLVLKPSDLDIESLFAGHRSHSSHSSHRSHSSHSSHASSSIGGYRSPSSTPIRQYSAPVRQPAASQPSPVRSPAIKQPAASRPASELPDLSDAEFKKQAQKTSASKYEPLKGVDLAIPEERFVLLSVHSKDDKPMAYIRDLANGKSKLVRIGEKIAEYTLVEVDLTRETAKLRADGMDITLTSIKSKK